MYCCVRPVCIITWGTVNPKPEILRFRFPHIFFFKFLVHVTNPSCDEEAGGEMPLLVIHDDNLKISRGELNGVKL